MPTHTVDNASSPDPRAELEGLVDSNHLWVSYNAASDRMRRSGEEVQPCEWETVSFWENMYNYVLLKGYSNNSQIPPFNESTASCDIATR